MSAATALTVAASDCGGLAGIAADLRSFWAFGVRGACAVTAVTAQDDGAVRGVSAVEPDLVRLQIDSVLDALPVTAIKTGMLAGAGTVEAVASALGARRPAPRLVVDPVLAASSGARLLDDAGREALVRSLLPMADLVTPNLPEAAALLGLDPADAASWTRERQGRAAWELAALTGCRAVLVKGGHREDGPACDALAHGGKLSWIEAPRIEAAVARGTGCTLSAAIAAGLALGWELERSVRAAKAFLTDALRRGLDVPPPPFDARRAGDDR